MLSIPQQFNPAPPRTEPEKLYQVAGNWYQVWSDAFFYQPTRAFSIDLTKVYQIVFPGYYYNVSPLVTASGTQTLFLKGVYTCSPCSPNTSPGRAGSRRAPT